MRLACLPIMLLAAAAGAQSVAAPRDTASPARIAELPSPRTATWMSVGFTIVPVVAGAIIEANSGSGSNAGGALFTTGLLIGPAVGFWTGHIGGKAWPGLLLRTGGLVVTAVGAGSCIGDLVSNTSCSTASSAAVIGGTLIVLGSAIYDMATVGRKVRAHNATATRATVLPLFSPSRRRLGVEIVVGF